MLNRSIQFAFWVALVTNLYQSLLSRNSDKPNVDRWGPIVLLTITTPLVLAESTLHVFRDTGCVYNCILKKYPDVFYACNIIGGFLLSFTIFWGYGMVHFGSSKKTKTDLRSSGTVWLECDEEEEDESAV